MGKFCGTQTSSPLKTSRNLMWIRFSSDSSDGASPSSNMGFTARIENTAPICGSHSVMNATNSWQVHFEISNLREELTHLSLIMFVIVKQKFYYSKINRCYKVLGTEPRVMLLTLVVNG